LNATTAFSYAPNKPLQNADELEAALRQIGATRYHNLHPSIGCCMAASSTRDRCRPGR
jgi:hypothetical protein